MLAKTDWPRDYQEQFWETYPRRIAKKAACKALDKIKKASEVPFEVLLSAVRVYAKSVAKKDMQFIAHPATWLNAGRWDDDPVALGGGNASAVANAFDELIHRAEEREREDCSDAEGFTIICPEGG